MQRHSANLLASHAHPPLPPHLLALHMNLLLLLLLFATINIDTDTAHIPHGRPIVEAQIFKRRQWATQGAQAGRQRLIRGKNDGKDGLEGR